MDFLFYHFIKICKTILVVVVSSRIILTRGRSLFLRTVFFKSIFSGFPYKTERKKIQGHIS